jgi:hypothetical protein
MWFQFVIVDPGAGIFFGGILFRGGPEEYSNFAWDSLFRDDKL